MTSPRLISKTPSETFDGTINWATRGLGADTISSSSWSVSPAGITILSGGQAPSFTNTTTTAWFSGGTAGVTYTVTNTITTAGGRTLQESYPLPVIEKRMI